MGTPVNLIDVNCYYCSSTRNQPYDVENGFQLVKCGDCGLIYLSPRPSNNEISAATKTGQHRGDELLNSTGSFNSNAITRYLRILGEFFPNRFSNRNSWLDIGCGHGEFLCALNRYFGNQIISRGCEPNSSKIASAVQHDLDVSFFDLSTHSETYDLVSALNVYSHLPDPIETLAEWKRLISPGGYLFLETGHSSHLPAKHHHKPYYLPDHLSFANRDIVESILVRLGFKVLETRIYRHSVFPEVSFGSVLRELFNFAVGRQNQLRVMFPHQAERDMFILAQRD